MRSIAILYITSTIIITSLFINYNSMNFINPLTNTSWLHSAFCFFFFFSSRRRHTRLQGDWSSDVCSSDLRRWQFLPAGHLLLHDVGSVCMDSATKCSAAWREELFGDKYYDLDIRYEEYLVRSEERRVGKECRRRWWWNE